MIHNTREHLESIQSSLYQIAQSRIRGGSARGDRTRDHWHHVDRLPTTFTAPRRSARPWSIARCLLILRSLIRSSTPRNASIHASCTTLIRRPAHRGSRITMITDRRRSHARKTHRSVLLFPPWSNAGIPREAPVDARASKRNPDHEFARDSEPTAARKISSARDKEGRDDNLLINLITLREARVG